MRRSIKARDDYRDYRKRAAIDHEAVVMQVCRDINQLKWGQHERDNLQRVRRTVRADQRVHRGSV